MDKFTKLIQEEVFWCIFYTEDIVLVNETGRGINVKLEIWRDTLGI